MGAPREGLGRTGNDALLREIRETYDYFRDYWQDARKNRALNLRYLSGDPWESKDRKFREDNGRIAINHDELNQYVFQGVNNLRQNRRGIKVDPRRDGANDKTAELRQDLLRTSEYDSQALDVYLRSAQDMYEGAYGFFRVTRDYAVASPAEDDPHAFDQVICFKPIPNPDSVLYDPHCKKADWSDARKVIVVEPMDWDDYKAQYPDAETVSFSSEDMQVASAWIQEKKILVAEYWKVESTFRTIERKGKRRRVEDKTVVQYVTNGVEILERNVEPGEEIPIPAMIGLERWVPEENGDAKRKLHGLPDFARDPQMSMAYLVSQQMEEAGMSPKVPVMGYTGQFETDKDTWDELHKVPHAYVQVDPVADPMNPTQVLPLPQWRQFVPNFQAFEIAKDSCRRAIQAAMGISPLPTAAQRQNEKSGVALERIENEQSIGSYHFTCGYDRAVARAGRIADSWIPIVYDTEREEMLRKPDDSARRVVLNTAEPYAGENGQPEHYPIGDEKHQVTVSTAPSFQSQRDAVSDFLDHLIEQLPKLPVPPPAAAKLLALAVQMKELGPKGDQMAEIISPTQGDNGQQLANMQQQMAQTQQAMQEMQGELQKLQLERAGKVIDNQFKIQIEKMREENALAIAEVNTKAQALSERMATFNDMMAQFHSQAHDAAMQAQDQQHEQGMAQRQQAAAIDQQRAEHAQESSMAQRQLQAQQQQPQQPGA